MSEKILITTYAMIKGEDLKNSREIYKIWKCSNRFGSILFT